MFSVAYIVMFGKGSHGRHLSMNVGSVEWLLFCLGEDDGEERIKHEVQFECVVLVHLFRVQVFFVVLRCRALFS